MALLYSVNTATSLGVVWGVSSVVHCDWPRSPCSRTHLIRQKTCSQRDGRKSSNGTDVTCDVKVTLPACSEKGDDGVVYSKPSNTLPDVDCMNLWLM